MRSEQWRPIAGWEGYYEISDLVRVRSLDRIFAINHSETKQWHWHRKGRLLKPTLNNNGYLIVMLSKHGKKKRYSLHRLIAETFIPNPGNKPQVNHKNLIKTDCRVSNLEWVNPSENARHAVGTRGSWVLRGSQRLQSKLTESDVLSIRSRLTAGEKRDSIARSFGVSYECICSIQTGKSWLWLTGPDRVVWKWHKSSRYPHAKLKESEVLKIRQRISKGEEQKSIALSFGISKGSICDIKHGRTWDWLPK